MSAFPDAVHSAWHMVALSRQVLPGKTLPAVLMDTPLALFRDGSGQVGALVDRCPHRNFPLSLGKVRQGAIECPYHGWRFAADGTCVDVPGCQLAPGDGQRLAASALRVAERHGAVFVALSPHAPAEPWLPPDFGNPALDHFWWQQGTWAGRAFDAIENVMDPFHTGHLHHGFIRRHDRRHDVQLVVQSHGDSLAMTIHQSAPDHGLMSRFLERERTHSVSTYYPPTTVQARWEGERRLTLCVTAIFTPATAGSFTPFARFSTPKGLAPAWLKQAAIRLFLDPVVAQDRRALEQQHGVMQHFGHPRFATGPGDLLGDRLHRLWKGERLPPGSDDPVPARL
ncbi:MAG: aromatic ring-hydroxylating dioxygenase subunit alpha [Erythrobacter sp.]|nr:aromatic ring-hydroxylating dioxygenase subunit alpha [Erythrobacter sp.]